MKRINHLITILFALIVFAATSSNVHALKTDRDQPAEIEADEIEFDFKKGTRTYINNVLLIQGSLRLKADKVVANYGENDLEKATAWGSLARFKQRPDGKPDDTEGWAKKIVVDQLKNTITLIGKAALKQGPNTARGDTIVYNTVTEKMKILGGSKVQAAGKDGQAPKRTLEDPFADDAQGPPQAPVAKAKSKPSTEKSAEDGASDADEDEVAGEKITEVEPQPAPTKSGRSRLIIQPK